MAQNPSSTKRSGDDYYTSSDTTVKIIQRFRSIFESYDYIWIPFNSEDKPIVSEFRKAFGASKNFLK